MTEKIISIKNLTKKYIHKNGYVEVLNKINFELLDNEIVSIIGPSGCGKSTFLNVVGLLDSSYSGEYKFYEENSNNFNNNKKNILRNTQIGFVHQFFHLIPELTIWENVALPKMIHTKNKKISMDYAENLINKFGLLKRINFKPLDLSGGEQQRVAIARALINNPKLVIADEMTGNLDEETSDLIFDFFLKEVKKNNQCLIYVTHNSKYASKADTRYIIEKKQIINI